MDNIVVYHAIVVDKRRGFYYKIPKMVSVIDISMAYKKIIINNKNSLIILENNYTLFIIITTNKKYKI